MKKNNAILDSLTKRIEAIRSSHPELFDNISNSILQFSKDLQSIESFSENMKMSRKNLRKFDRTAKLQIGGGHRLLAGYINLDIFLPADIVWDVRSGIPFPDSRFDEIFCEHFFEHLDYPKSASNFLSEAYRTLNKGGVLKIVVPDCGAPITQYCKNNNRYFKKMVNFNYSKRLDTMKINSSMDVINYLFRDQFENPSYTVHWWAYDHKNLTKLLKISGFSSVKEWKFDEKICNPKRKDYSLYIIAKK